MKGRALESGRDGRGASIGSLKGLQQELEALGGNVAGLMKASELQVRGWGRE